MSRGTVQLSLVFGLVGFGGVAVADARGQDAQTKDSNIDRAALDQCAGLPESITTPLCQRADTLAQNGAERKTIVRELRTWCQDNGIDLNDKTQLCVSAISRSVVRQRPATPPSKTTTLKRMLEQNVRDVHLRYTLESIWETYRSLDQEGPLEAALLKNVQDTIRTLYARLRALDPGLTQRRPYDRTQSAKWNRENMAIPVHQFDDIKDCVYTRPYQLAVLREPVDMAEVVPDRASDDGNHYLLLKPDRIFSRGRKVLIELPRKDIWWDFRARGIRVLAELRPFKNPNPKLQFGTLLKPLILEAVVFPDLAPEGGRVLYSVDAIEDFETRVPPP